MPRLSVYVPDELFEQAKRLDGSDNTSQLVQRGLQRLLEDQRRPPRYAEEPEEGLDLVIEAQKRLLVEARKDYERGYVAALEAAAGMSLHELNALVDADFDLEKWLEPFKRGARAEMVANTVPVTDPAEIERVLAEMRGPNGDQLAGAGNKSDPWWWLWRTAESLGDLADPIGFDAFSFRPTKARRRGYVDALRELWQSLESPALTREEVRERWVEMGRQRSSGARGPSA